jgi:hypothetical protein
MWAKLVLTTSPGAEDVKNKKIRNIRNIAEIGSTKTENPKPKTRDGSRIVRRNTTSFSNIAVRKRPLKKQGEEKPPGERNAHALASCLKEATENPLPWPNRAVLLAELQGRQDHSVGLAVAEPRSMVSGVLARLLISDPAGSAKLSRERDGYSIVDTMVL